MFTSAQTQKQRWATAYLSVGDFKQIGNICNDICNPRKVMLMQKQTETKAVENTCSALWKRKVGDGGGSPLTNMTECGERQGEMKSGCCGRDLCARENSHFLLTSICTLTSNPHTIVSHPPPIPSSRPDQGWMVDVGGSVCLLCSGLCINVEL